MNKKEFISSLKSSFKAIKDKYYLILIGIIAELAFLFLFITFAIPFRNGIGNNLLELGDIIVAQSQQAIGNTFVSDIISSVAFKNIMLMGIILAIATYFLYCIFHGFIWRFCLNLAGKKERYIPYIKKFCLVNLFWCPLFMIYVLVNFIFSYIDIVGKRTDPNGWFFMGNVTNIFLFLIIYFALISYVKIEDNKVWKSIRESFRIGIKRFFWVICMYLIIAVLFIAANYLLIPIGRLYDLLVIFIGTMVIIPIMLWARIFIKKVVDSL